MKMEGRNILDSFEFQPYTTLQLKIKKSWTFRNTFCLGVE